MDCMQICKNNSQQLCEIQTQNVLLYIEARRGRVSICYVVHEGRGEAKKRKRDEPKLVKRSLLMNNWVKKDQVEVQRLQKQFQHLARYFNTMTRNSMRYSQIIYRSPVEGNRLKSFPFFEISLSQRFFPSLTVAKQDDVTSCSRSDWAIILNLETINSITRTKIVELRCVVCSLQSSQLIHKLREHKISVYSEDL